MDLHEQNKYKLRVHIRRVKSWIAISPMYAIFINIYPKRHPFMKVNIPHMERLGYTTEYSHALYFCNLASFRGLAVEAVSIQPRLAQSSFVFFLQESHLSYQSRKNQFTQCEAPKIAFSWFITTISRLGLC